MTFSSAVAVGAAPGPRPGPTAPGFRGVTGQNIGRSFHQGSMVSDLASSTAVSPGTMAPTCRRGCGAASGRAVGPIHNGLALGPSLYPQPEAQEGAAGVGPPLGR